MTDHDKLEAIERICREAFSQPDTQNVELHRAQALANVYGVILYDGMNIPNIHDAVSEYINTQQVTFDDVLNKNRELAMAYLKTYESPVMVMMDQVATEIREQGENQMCMDIIQRYDLQCNKEELLKALAYDRDQYEKGYHDACKKLERPRGEWIKITKNGTLPVEYICSVCGRKIFDNYDHQIPQSEFYPYCHCGADMRGDQK